MQEQDRLKMVRNLEDSDEVPQVWPQFPWKNHQRAMTTEVHEVHRPTPVMDSDDVRVWEEIKAKVKPRRAMALETRPVVPIPHCRPKTKEFRIYHKFQKQLLKEQKEQLAQRRAAEQAAVANAQEAGMQLNEALLRGPIRRGFSRVHTPLAFSG